LNKHKADYIPYGLEGDKYVIVNAEKVTMTGNKMKDSINYYHTGYPGGIRGKSKGAILESSTPEKVLISSIKRMMPRWPRGRHLLKNLLVYKGDSHLTAPSSLKLSIFRPTIRPISRVLAKTPLPSPHLRHPRGNNERFICQPV
jgi:ribosomal protein L13